MSECAEKIPIPPNVAIAQPPLEAETWTILEGPAGVVKLNPGTSMKAPDHAPLYPLEVGTLEKVPCVFQRPRPAPPA